MGSTRFEDWVQAAQEGDTAAQDRICRFLWKILFPWLRTELRQRCDAEDVMIETLKRVLEGLKRLKTAKALPGWARTIARRALREWRAARKQQPRAVRLDDAPEPSAFDTALGHLEREEELEFVSRGLSSEENRLFSRLFSDGLSPREVALQEGISLNAVACRIHDLRVKVRRLIRAFRRNGNGGIEV